MFRTSVRLLVLASVASFSSSPLVSQGPVQPNVLFIYIDDASYEMGTFGHPVVQTPNLDDLATRGTVFMNAYCPYPVCGPSRLATMLSRRPARTGLLGNQAGSGIQDPVFDGTPLMPKRFRDAGYWTGGVGKIFHVDQVHPNTWDLYTSPPSDFGIPRPAHPAPEDGWRTIYGGPFENGPDGSLGDMDDTNSSDDAIAMMQLAQEPWFIAVGYRSPHNPYVYPEAFDSLYDPAVDVPALPPGESTDWSASLDPAYYYNFTYVDPAWGATEDERRREATVAYWRTMTYIDHEIGRVLSALDALGETDDTIVVVLSDHGWSMGHHGRYDKNDLWDRAVKAPMLLSVPWLPNAGQVTSEFVEHIDLYPTLMHYCNLAPPAGLEGDNLQPLMDDPTAPQDDVYSMVTRGWSTKWHHMVRSGDYKYIHHEDGAHMLYDVQVDPGEYVNLYGDPAYQAVADSLQQGLRNEGLLDAFSSNYRLGSPGSNGELTLTLDGPPILGTTLGFEFGNAAGVDAPTLFLGGFDATNLSGPEVLGGPLLLVPHFGVPFQVPVGGLVVPLEVPLDPFLAERSTLFQIAQLDFGVPAGVSWSRGLRMFANF